MFLLCSHYTVHFVDETIFKRYNNTAPATAPSLKKILRKEKKEKKGPPDSGSGAEELWFCITQYRPVRSARNNCQSFLMGSCRCDKWVARF